MASDRPVSLVTGACGFIASHLTERLLAEGHHVIGVDGFTNTYDVEQKRDNERRLRTHPEYEHVEGHLMDLDIKPLTDRARFVFHLAARAGVREGWSAANYGKYIHDNSLSTQRLAEAALESGVELFSFASTSSIYGFNPKLPTPEDHALQPRSFYAMTKSLDENLLLGFQQLFGLPVVILRYYTLFGPRQRPDMLAHIALKRIAEGKPITIYGDGEQTRELTYVMDAVEAQARVLDVRPIGEVYNIGSGPRVSVNEFVREMEAVVGRPAKLVHEAPHPADQLHSQADISKARQELGFNPTTTVREGLEAEYAWLRESVLVPA